MTKFATSSLNGSAKIKLLLTSLILCTFLCGLYLFNPPLIQFLTYKSTDLIMNFGETQAQPSGPQIEIVEVDDQSLKKYGQWPWPRHRLANLLSKISSAGATSIGLNIIFAETDRTSPLVWQQELERDFGISVSTTTIPEKFLDHDRYLASVFNSGPFVLAHKFLFNGEGQPGKTAKQCKLQSISLGFQARNNTPPPIGPFHQATGTLCNNQGLLGTTKWSGFLNGTPDLDGVLRRMPIVLRLQDNYYPSFGLSMLLNHYGLDSLILTRQNGILHLIIGEFVVPLDDAGNFLLTPFQTEPKPPISAADILEDRVDPKMFRDKMVLVGISASGLRKEFLGVQGRFNSPQTLHKYSIESLTADHHPVRSDIFRFSEAGVAMVLSILLFSMACYLPVGSAVVLWLALLSSIPAGIIWLYQTTGLLFSPLLPFAVCLLSFALLLVLKYYQIQKDAKSETGTALQLLQTSEASLQSIMNTIPDIVFRLDNRGNIVFISPAITRYLDSSNTLLGKSIFQLVAPEDLEKSKFRLNERRTGKRATHNLEIRLLLGAEQDVAPCVPRIFSVSAEGIYNTNRPGQNAFIGTQGIVRDVTEHKRLENQLIQAQKMEVVGNLAAGIAHDLNNILSGLVSYPDILLQEIPKDNPLHQKIAVIQRSGQKAAVIVQDLLTLARRSIMTQDVCKVNEIISDYINSIEFEATLRKNPQIHIQTKFQKNLLNIKGSEVHLSKAFMNIISNAVEAMPAGGNIRIITDNSYLDIPLFKYEEIPEGEYVVVTITDSGVGIPKEDLKRIFEPFFTRKSMHLSGTGLGMTIIWATIKDHQGYIDIESSEGTGTSFTVYLPTTREEEEHPQQRIALDDYLGTETILIVDDMSDQLEIGRNILEKLGYKVITADSGESGVEVVRKHAVDLIVLDMIMVGGIDGLETYERIIKINPQQRAIITSGFSESERVKSMQRLGAGSYVQKPYSMESLGVAVRAELDKIP